MTLSLKILGGFTVENDSGVALSLPTRKARALLGYLAANTDRPQSRGKLAALLWSDHGEKQARHNLNQSLVAIRKLGQQSDLSLLHTNSDNVWLIGDDVEIDMVRFRSLLDENPSEAASLYQGPLLEGLPSPDPAFEEWLIPARMALHELACVAFEKASTGAAQQGRPDNALEFARRLVALDPLRESAHRLLMRQLRDSGDRAGALRQYRACADILKRDLQVDPEPRTQALFEEIKGKAGSDAKYDPSPHPPVGRGLSDKPSIAVLAFDNMSDDPNQEFFGDGMAEDIITALSRFRSLHVIARNSCFTYKGKRVSITEIAHELGVRYVLEGSVRKSKDRVRVSAQLIDATVGTHLWADRFDGGFDDIFDLQDRIAEQVVVAVEPEILAHERKRARRKAPERLDAWELLQRGLSHFYQISKANRSAALRLFREAIAKDPDFAAVHAYLAHGLVDSRSMGLGKAFDLATALMEARPIAEKAISLDPNEPMAHFALGRVHIFSGEIDMAIGAMQRAIAVNPNFALGHHGLGFVYYYNAAQWEQALIHLDTGLRLSPRDPMRWAMLSYKGATLRNLGRIKEAIAHCEQACQIPASGHVPHVQLAAALAEAGRINEAREEIEKIIRLEPAFSIRHIRSRTLGIHEATLNGIIASIRKAGAPES